MTIKFGLRKSLEAEVYEVIDKIVPRMFSNVELVDLHMNVYVPKRAVLKVVRALGTGVHEPDFNPGTYKPVIVEVIGE